MPFAKIPLKFSEMEPPYRDNQSLPLDIVNWLKDQNKREDDFNANLEALNAQRAEDGKKPLAPMGHSTSCCMQASLSFNATGQPIPKPGSRDRDNTTLNGGKNYILAVGEFRAYLTYRYGPTDQVNDWGEIKGKTGVLIFGGAHIELWDGDQPLQSAKGLAAHNRNSGAVMRADFLATKPQWFWETIGDKTEPASDIPDWLVGWWTIYDGAYYYYYFFHDGSVVYIEQKPNPKWTPPKTIGNRGVVVKNDAVHGFTVTWGVLKGEAIPTIEDFTPRNWSSRTEMNATSNKYSPIYAIKM
ncbi:MAG: hypothetical protein KGM15_05140 [Pseudomonadota bacterium]|nr:hypothetical protein [Pseudomonadota bacterium]